MIQIRDILTLSDDHEYVVVGKTDEADREYYYLIDKNNVENIKFCYLEKDELVEIEDSELIKSLLPIFLESAHDTFVQIEQELTSK